MVLTEGYIEEIDDTVLHVTNTLWINIEYQYKVVFTEFQQGIKELQVQANVVQARVTQASVAQACMTQASMVPQRRQGKDLVVTPELCILQVPGGALNFERIEDHERAQQWRKLSINLDALPIQALHYFHQGFAEEL